tara:strand:+ start:638 stop:1144 length:507 start_codon:yes stop_codon:yes gene_type:complete
MPTNPISPWSSSFGSTPAEAPGRLKDAAPATVWMCLQDTPDGQSEQISPFMSGTGGTNVGAGYTSLRGLEEGETVSIFAINANSANASTDPYRFALMASGHNMASSCLLAGTACKQGPWFQNFEIPIQVKGPARVWMQAQDTGAASTDTYNYVSIAYFRTDASQEVIT